MNDVMKFAAILMMALQCFPAKAQQEAKTQVNRTPWHVALDAGVEQEHVAFLSRGPRLSGTLYYPSGQHPGTAVVVLHGASSPSQDLPLYEHLKQILPRLGVAVFVRHIGFASRMRSFHGRAELHFGKARVPALAENFVDVAIIGQLVRPQHNHGCFCDGGFDFAVVVGVGAEISLHQLGATFEQTLKILVEAFATETHFMLRLAVRAGNDVAGVVGDHVIDLAAKIPLRAILIGEGTDAHVAVFLDIQVDELIVVQFFVIDRLRSLGGWQANCVGNVFLRKAGNGHEEHYQLQDQIEKRNQIGLVRPRVHGHA